MFPGKSTLVACNMRIKPHLLVLIRMLQATRLGDHALMSRAVPPTTRAAPTATFQFTRS